MFSGYLWGSAGSEEAPRTLSISRTSDEEAILQPQAVFQPLQLLLSFPASPPKRVRVALKSVLAPRLPVCVDRR